MSEVENLKALLEEQKRLLEEQQKRIERMEAVNAIQSILSRYAAYHVASEQEKTADLYCRHTPGTRLVFNGDIYDEWEGVKRHFIYRMRNAEEDPCYDVIGTAPQELKDSTAAHPECQPQRKTKKPYLGLSTETPECDAHNLIPVPPLPYDVTDPERFRDEDDTDWKWE